MLNTQAPDNSLCTEYVWFISTAVCMQILRVRTGVFLCILFNSGCFLNTFYTALDRLDFWNFGLKSSRGSKLLSEWKFDRKILFFRQPLLVLTCRHPQSFIGCFEEEEDFMSEYSLTSYIYDLLNREGTCLSRILIFQRQNI